jgi:hypothetical protein
MPFTPAHPAIVVPLARWKPGSFVLSALIVGSLAPDFEYFVHMRPVRTIGHNLHGIPLMCVPAGLVVLWVFEYVLKRPLIHLLPTPHRRCLLAQGSPIPFLPASQLGLILLSLAIGAFSHIAWDSFTHENGWVVERIPYLLAPLTSFWGHELRVFKFLQHGSTVIGLAVLAYWYWRWFKGSQETIDAVDSTLSEHARLAVTATLVAIPCGFGVLSAFRDSSGGLFPMTGQFVVAAISVLCLLVLGYSVLFCLLERRAQSQIREARGTTAPSSQS